MRGKRCAGLRLVLLPVALLGAGAAAAKTATSAPRQLPRRHHRARRLEQHEHEDSAAQSKIAAVRLISAHAWDVYADRVAFGLVAFGHRKASNCADSELIAKPGELTFEAQSKFLGRIKPKGQAPIAAALSDAAKAAHAGRLDIVLIADGGDTCNADVCATAVALKEKSRLRIHVIGFDGKAEETLSRLACVAASTGGKFVTAANANELKQGLDLRARRSRTPAAPRPASLSRLQEPAAGPPMPSAGSVWPPPASISTQPPVEPRPSRRSRAESRKRSRSSPRLNRRLNTLCEQRLPKPENRSPDGGAQPKRRPSRRPTPLSPACPTPLVSPAPPETPTCRSLRRRSPPAAKVAATPRAARYSFPCP